MDLVLDAIETRHEQRRISQIRVGHRVGEADFHALGFRTCAIRNAARCRPVARRICEQYGGFIAGHQTLVAVGRRVGEGVDRLCVLDDAADEIEAHVGKACISVTCKQRFLALPDRQVGVHARAVIFLDRFGHEGRGLAISMRHLMHDILIDLHAVGGLRQRAKGQTKLVLGGGDFMVVLVARQAHFEHG